MQKLNTFVPLTQLIFAGLLWPKIQGDARNVIPLIVHVTHFYYYKNISHLVQN